MLPVPITAQRSLSAIRSWEVWLPLNVHEPIQLIGEFRKAGQELTGDSAGNRRSNPRHGRAHLANAPQMLQSKCVIRLENPRVTRPNCPLKRNRRPAGQPKSRIDRVKRPMASSTSLPWWPFAVHPVVV